jgi:flagellar motor switch protein FliN/FliY
MPEALTIRRSSEELAESTPELLTAKEKRLPLVSFLILVWELPQQSLSSLLNQKVNISTPVCFLYAKWEIWWRIMTGPVCFLQLSYKEGLHGNNILVLKQNDVKIITDLMMVRGRRKAIQKMSWENYI